MERSFKETVLKLIVFVSTLESGGVAAVVLAQAKACARLCEDFHVDFACCISPSEERARDLAGLGATAYHLTPFSSNPFEYCRDAERAIRESGCDAVHVHLGHLSWVVCRVAKACGVKRRVVHSHSELPRSMSLPFKVAMGLAPALNRRYATAMFACSEPAGVAYFGKGFEFLPNIVDFSVNSSDATITREQYDSEFSFDSSRGLRVGFLGALDVNKRPEFALALSKRLSRDGVEHCLIMAGDGPRRVEMEAMAEGDPHVHVLGQRGDSRSLLRYFDFLVVPSIVEGMSLSALEAQLSGTMCLASDSIPGTNDLGLGLFRQLLCDDPGRWADAIEEIGAGYKVPTEAEMMRRLVAIGYDSDTVAMRLLESYGGCQIR